MRSSFPEAEVTRSLSNNLLKSGFTKLVEEDTRVIDMNGLVAKRIRELSAKMQQEEGTGFVSGLARTQAEAQKADVLEQARSQGQQEAKAEADRTEAQRTAEYQKKEAGLEAEYQKMIDELEPKFVDTITGIYEHIFHVDLHSYREVLCYLISSTMRKTEDNRSFLVHVSKEDYPYVSMQKKQIMTGATSPNSTVEIVEDITLGKGECLIETESGIFDCGLGTQLSELRQKLKLLSYEG